MKSSYQALAVVMVGATVVLAALSHLGGSRAPATASSRMGAATRMDATSVAEAQVHLRASSGSVFSASCDNCFRQVSVEDDDPFNGATDRSALLAADDPFVADPRPTLYGGSAAPIAAPAPEISTAAMIALGVALITGRRARRSGSVWRAAWRPATVETV